MTRELSQILRATSRSFWLTIRALPPPMREGVALGYLAARLADTLADQGHWPVSQRQRALAAWQAVVNLEAGELESVALAECDYLSVSDLGEQRLLATLPTQIENLLNSQPPRVRVHLSWVLRHIIEGQRWDLGRFGDATSVTCLAADEELLRYCWRVAGSVGEFWGCLRAATLGERFAEAATGEWRLAMLGGRYGEALQLINILRDLPEDWQRGRCYLPGNWSSAAEAWQQAGPRWIVEAKQRLASASAYVGQLRGRRLRLATALPAALGWRTLQRLAAADYAALAARVKVPRSEVRALLAQGLWASRSASATQAWLEKLARETAARGERNPLI